VRIGPHTIEPATALAPMAAITNPPFRQICLEAGAGLVCSEMLAADQVVRTDREPSVERCPGERVLVAQLYGRSPKVVARAAAVVVEQGADVVDINMGCPARKVVFHGAGVALMREPDLARLVVDAVCRAVRVPVTVKMRAGFDASEVRAPEIARLVVDAGAVAVTVHARTRLAVHTGPPDWEVIRRVRDALPASVPVVGNGGITGLEAAREMTARTGCDGVMVGRGARGNPWIFTSMARGEAVVPAADERMRVMLRHLGLYVAWAGEERAVREFRKHVGWYLRGLRGAVRLRSRLAELHTFADVERLAAEAR
jgi:nifR3 family TIM-barrel protein